MRKFSSLLVALLVGAPLFFACACAAVDHSPVSSSPYGGDQATHGQAIYQNWCAACHASRLEGGMGPSLKGAPFWTVWNHKPAKALFGRIISTMPQDSPGALSEKDVLDVMAYILSQNGVPPGSAPINSADALTGVELSK